MALPAGTILEGRYEVVEVLGEGAMSTVYLVSDTTESHRALALKVLDPQASTPAEAAEAMVLFEQEIEILSLLQHPCIPRLRGTFTESGCRCFLMDYVDGRTLEAIVDKNGAAPESYVLPLAIQMASLLSWLHTHPRGPIVFRDMKPSNVMVDYEGRVHLIDFGVARFWKPGQVTDTFPMGTPGFAAPEQYGAAQSGPSTDLYAMAATLYRTLTGQDPDPSSPSRPLLRTAAPSCSEEMEALLSRCLEADPDRRPRAASEVLAGLFELRDMRFPEVDIPRLPAPAPASPVLAAGSSGSWLTGGVRAIFIGLLLLGVAYTLYSAIHLSFRPARSPAPASGCKYGLKSIGTALEMYSTDNGGQFPPSISLLVPKYLEAIPTCSSARADTYSEGYEVWNGRASAYTVLCRGHYHIDSGYSANYPQYTSTQGLLER